jgi:DNA topoisomerase-1
MRDRHASVEGSTVRFEFRGKSGRRHGVDVRSRQLARVVKQCQDVPGQELFQYLDDEGSRRDITSADVNDYLREIAGEEFTAKDFRTWAGTLHAATALLECGPCGEEKEARGRVTEAVKRVAERLGNTPTICRECYIHPAVIDVYLKGALGELLDPGSKVVRYRKVKGLTEEESAVLALLEDSAEE